MSRSGSGSLQLREAPQPFPATFARDETVVGLLKSDLERYWPGHDGEQERVRQSGGTFCGTYCPEDIAPSITIFLDYFMPTKVIGGEGMFQGPLRG